MEQPQQRRPGLVIALLVIAGFTAGAIVGLLLGWVVWPVDYVDTSLADLAPKYKDEYMLLVAWAYVADGDLGKAEARLAQLELPNTQQSLSALIDRYIAEGQDEADIGALATLGDALGVSNQAMLAYLATSTPLPTNTPSPTPTPTPTNTPTATPTETPVPPTDTPLPPTETPVPPTDTPVPPTDTPKPQPTNTPKPQPTNTPKPQPTNTPKPAAKWTIVEARLVGPGEDGQRCDGGGNLQIRATVIDANGNQIPGVWIHDQYSGQNRVTGHKGADAFWGPGEAEFVYYRDGGGSLCISSGEGGPCESAYTRAMPCFRLPPIEDLHAAGYCACHDPNASVEKCREMQPIWFPTAAGHFAWRVIFKRSW
jgi:hypothetical protein